MIVVAADPGVTTGIAIFYFGPNNCQYLFHEQYGDPDTAWKRLHDLVHQAQEMYPEDEVILVVEQFDKRPGVVHPDFTPKYITRDIEINITDVEIVWQIPDMAKTMVPPARKGTSDALKRMGWYLVSNVHANDAARHAVAYAVATRRHMPTILRGWPKPKDTDD